MPEHSEVTMQAISRAIESKTTLDSKDWRVVEGKEITRETLERLFRNEIAGFVLPGFISEELCRLAVKGVLAHGVDYYKDVYPKIGKVGITQFEYSRDLEQKMKYFAEVPRANSTRREMLKESGDLLPEVIQCLKEAWKGDVGIAVEDGVRKEYFGGLVRVLSTPLLLHYDWGPFDGPAWTISQVSAQITWNIFLQTGSSGGATIVYHRPWKNESDETYVVPGSYEYDHSAVMEADSVRIAPRVGDLTIFNSRNFHEVEETRGGMGRITISSFIGLIEAQNRLVLWS